ncbi:Alpha/Beta hydrolase protein [Roridomyces roridus]|uniref:Alpha/Beta hydrolase protein n=1 Tax=Roridomyces roridus TaxID=1738132 RepID=A0AAD7C848_9AGAR|nr:Alpha/Beta hydrolase protein [Roridomyces roridus]
MSSPTIAHPHSEDCFTGVKHSGTAVGKTETIAGVPTYVSDPPSSATGPKKIVLFLADVYGPFYLNNQLLQDYFAAQGFTVVGIDYFLGDPVHIHTEEGFDRDGWFAKSRKQANEMVPRWLEEIRKRYGYCFGAPYVMDLGATDNIVAGAFAHPAALKEEHFRNLKQPLLLSCAETDFTFPLEFRRRAEDILVEIKAQYEIQVFARVSHGFAVRGDPAIPDARWAKEESARGIIAWFGRFSA